MRRAVWVGLGGAVGFVLGARSGRGTYDRLQSGATRSWARIGGKEATAPLTNSLDHLGESVLGTVHGTVAVAASKAAETVTAVADKVDEVAPGHS